LTFPTRSELVARALTRSARATLTAASRITTPTYPVIYITIGLLFLTQAPSRTSSDAFDVARMVFDITTWGLAFLIIGLVEAVALAFMTGPQIPTAARAARVYVWALVIGSGLAAFWTTVMFAAALRSDAVSFTSAVWLAGITVFHIASARSLSQREAS
jgi:hypothetical protein